MNSSLEHSASDFATIAPMALKYLEGTLPTPPLEWLAASYLVASSAYDAGDYQKAADIFRMFVLLRPTDSKGWFGLAACHDASQEYDRAVALFTAALHADHGSSTDRARAGVYLARALTREARFDEAKECLDRIDASDIDPALSVLHSAVLSLAANADSERGKRW